MKLNLDFSKLKPQHIPMLMALQNNYQLTLRSEKGSKLTKDELDNNFRFFLDNIVPSGTPSEVTYFGQDGFLTSDSGFTRTEDTTQIIHTFWTPNYAQFSGTGSQTTMLGLAANGYYTGPTTSVYTVTISATGPNDFFDWFDNTGASGSNIEIDTSNGNLLDSDVAVYFPNSDGHDIGDTWTFDMIEISSFHINGNVLDNNAGIANATIDETNSIVSINLLGNGSGTPNGAVFGLINNSTFGQGLVNITSNDGISFQVDIYAGDANNGSQLTMEDTIRFNFNGGDEYYFPTTNASGPLVNDGSGNLSFTTAWSGTYSTGEGLIVTVTNGLITNVGS